MTEESKPRVLCVDDEPRVLIGLKRQLSRDYDVSTAASGAEGLEILERDSSVAVLIADLRMPGMDGIAFLREARIVSPDSVGLVLTGFGDAVELADALDERLIFRVLDKPWVRGPLLSAVREAVEVWRERLSQ